MVCAESVQAVTLANMMLSVTSGVECNVRVRGCLCQLELA